MAIKRKANIYGYIEYNEEKYPFVINEFVGRIYDALSNKRFDTNTSMPVMLYGKTDENFDIAINVVRMQKNFKMVIFNIAYYIVSPIFISNCDLSKMKEIRFIGGTLNKILDPSLIYEIDNCTNPIEKGCSINFRPIKEVTNCYSLNLNNTDIVLKSSIIPYEDRKDNSLGKTNSIITLIFNEDQHVLNFLVWYKLIVKLVIVLVGQKNIEFDKIQVCFDYNDKKICADLFVNIQKQDPVQKASFYAISINKVKDKLPLLLQKLDMGEFTIDFLPASNDDAKIMNIDYIKNICTALELEYNLSKKDLNSNRKKDIVIDNLIRYIKGEIKNYKSNNSELSDKTYQSILSNVSRWNLTLSERIYCLYEENKIILEKIFSEKNFKITPEKIQDFVKCRNDSTHANSVWLTEEVAKTAYCLKALIYINFFKRIGLSEEEIFKAIEWFF